VDFVNNSQIYTPAQIDECLQRLENVSLVRTKNNRALLYNAPCSFDIETSSFYMDRNGKTYEKNDKKETRQKVAIMYEWTLGINGAVIIGRKWDDFIHTINHISKKLKLNDKKRLIIYVHNLSYEFQFIRKRFTWTKVFAVDIRKPVYAITDNGIEFRDSYILSGYSLAKLGDELQKYPVKKMTGDLDYSKIRHAETPLTDKEIKYCENDVRVVMSFIQEKIEQDGNIGKIPLTKTSYVRQFCKNACLYIPGVPHKKPESINKYRRYRELMNILQLTPDEYRQCKRAFQGGFTHCNALYSGKVMCDVASYDFTSSYPTVMVAEMFPMSRGKKIEVHNKKEFENYLKYYCCMFDIELTNVKPKVFYENPLSLSRCYGIENPITNNGRVVYADKLRTTVTEQDFFILRDFYEWDKMGIADFRIYHKGYLPTDFVKAILKLYEDKTTLKGVKGKEVEYLAGKAMLNACYGMAVTDIVRDENVYIDDWSLKPADILAQVKKYNHSKNRFLFYPWGIWVTAYARRNLFTGIKEFKTDYIYSDTDSIKVINYNKHKNYIDCYNKNIEKKLYMACKHHGIDFNKVKPKTIQGKEKLLGVWDFEGIYKRFKSIGAKRYLVENQDGSISMTVSGVNKKVALPYLLEKYGKDELFKKFNHGLSIPAEYTGKNTHTYIDTERQGLVKDYKGQYLEFDELSSVHLEGASFEMSLSRMYLDYLKGIRQHEK
jgi:hypothetical protein